MSKEMAEVRRKAEERTNDGRPKRQGDETGGDKSRETQRFPHEDKEKDEWEAMLSGSSCLSCCAATE